MLKKVFFIYKGKKFAINARSCNSFRKFIGLMFSRREKTEALLFAFKKQVDFRIHSFFVFFPFVAVWLDEKNDVIEIKKVTPFTVSVRAKRPYKKLLEIPWSSRYRKNIKLLFPRVSPSVIRKI